MKEESKTALFGFDLDSWFRTLTDSSLFLALPNSQPGFSASFVVVGFHVAGRSHQITLFPIVLRYLYIRQTRAKSHSSLPGCV
jgi:hypothetical protein